MKSLSFIALTVLTAVNAASVTFKVIAPDTQTDVHVSIGGQLTALTASDSDIPYYTGTAELAANATYQVKPTHVAIIIVVTDYLILFMYSMLLMVLLRIVPVHWKKEPQLVTSSIIVQLLMQIFQNCPAFLLTVVGLVVLLVTLSGTVTTFHPFLSLPMKMI